ncbi:MAG TPA: endolytic transglycosylase MltG, partial [Puia sp.]|nr:endolytic transglycosylase MltG [Puia sp.]
MKRFFIVLGLVLLLSGAWLSWECFGPSTAFSADQYFLYINTGMRYDELMETLKKDTVLKSPWLFSWIAARAGYPANIKAGKYEIKKGMNLLSLVRMLRNGKQIPVNLVITKLRTREDLASMVGRKLECDSASFIAYLNNEDSLKQYQLDSNTVMAAVLPDTYTYFWNSSASRVFRKFYTAYKNFWTPQRMEQAREHALTPVTAYILASIVEEETNRRDDKGKIASVYLNRINKGMKLAADPTVKFALRNFELKRIYDKYLEVESPYNTYRHEGLPPGPICTPSEETIDA